METRTVKLVWNVNTELLSLVGLQHQELTDKELIAHTCAVMGGWEQTSCVVIRFEVPTGA